jgi:hypothetical protein
MASLSYQLRLAIVAAVILFCNSIRGPQCASAAPTFQVDLQLDAPGGAVNNFDLGLVLDALFAPYRAVPANGTISLGGTLRAALALTSEGGLTPQVVGLSLQGTPNDLNQSNLVSNFGVPTGSVDFATSSVVGCMESHPGATMTEVKNGEFARDDFRLVLMGGAATVTVPSPKPARGQKIDDVNIVGLFPTTDELIGRVNIAHLSGLDYQVTLGIPMAGLAMTIAKAGLPVAVTYNSGELRATGVFTVPEPAATALSAVALLACQSVRRLRVGRIRAA